MNKVILLLVLGAMTGEAVAQASHSVNGYIKKDGTYVAPHHATNPDGNPNNNYTSQGHYNPYTGKEGTKPYQPYTPPLYNDGSSSNQ